MKKVFLLFLLTFTGWFNEEVQAQCMQSTPFAENFDGNSWISPSGWNNNGSIPSCWTRNLTNRNYLWMPSDPSFVSANSGPAGDHTTGSGGYAFAEGWFTGITTTNQDVTNLITPPIDLSTDTLPRLVFYYHMFGSDITWLNICDTTVLNPTYVVNGLQVAFDGASSSSGTGLAYYWSFGNGILGQGDTLTVNYATAGVYTVSLLAVNSCGDSILTSFDVTLCPLVNLTFSSTVVGNLFTFSAQPSNLLNYQWDFGDGNAGTGAVVSNSYGTNGSFTVTLSGQDSCGNTFVYSDIVATCDLPQGDFTFSLVGTGSTGLIVNFQATATGANQYHWFWGDGTFDKGNAPNLQHTYGVITLNYSVTLLLINDCGDTTSVTRSLNEVGISETGTECRLYPNPTRASLRVEFPQTINTRVQLFSSIGAIVHDVTTENSSWIDIDMSDFPSGTYALRVLIDDLWHYYPLVKI